MKDSFYFCLELTENEHYIVEDYLTKFLKRCGGQLIYYRRLKEGHVPMIREVKIRGVDEHVIRDCLKKEFIDQHMVKNPHKA